MSDYGHQARKFDMSIAEYCRVPRDSKMWTFMRGDKEFRSRQHERHRGVYPENYMDFQPSWIDEDGLLSGVEPWAQREMPAGREVLGARWVEGKPYPFNISYFGEHSFRARFELTGKKHAIVRAGIIEIFDTTTKHLLERYYRVHRDDETEWSMDAHTVMVFERQAMPTCPVILAHAWQRIDSMYYSCTGSGIMPSTSLRGEGAGYGDPHGERPTPPEMVMVCKDMFDIYQEIAEKRIPETRDPKLAANIIETLRQTLRQGISRKEREDNQRQRTHVFGSPEAGG